MIKNKKIILLVAIFILSNFTLASLQVNAYSVDVNSVSFNTSNVSFSINPHFSQESTDIFSIYNDFNNFYLTLSTAYTYSPVVAHSEGIIPVSSVVKNYSQILDQNFYISNTVEFIAISTSFNGIFSLTIKNLQTNQTLSEQGITPYKIALVTSFNNSIDVYFSFYNETMFNIAKYSFQTNNFLISSHSKNFAYNNYFLSNVDVFKLNNKLYSSFITNDNISSTLTYNSTILIFNNNNTLFNKTFDNIAFDFFTPTPKGFILHFSQSLVFYDYHFSTNSFFSTGLSFSSIVALKPCDNTSFMLLSPDSLYQVSINTSSNINQLKIAKNFDLTNNSYNKEIFCFNLNSGDYYILGMQIQSNQYVISKNNYGQIPVLSQSIPYSSIYNPSTPSGASSTTAPAPGPVTSPSPSTPYSYQSQSTSTFQSVITPDPSGIIFLFLIFIIGVIGVIAYSSRQRRKEQDYNTRYPSNSYSNQNQGENSGYQYFRKTKFCIDCGSPVEPDDVFCQNCGRRI